MNSLFILIPIALILLSLAIYIFIWSVKSGQLEDLDTEGRRILFDRDTPKKNTPSDASKNTKQTVNRK
ncbi:MAG: cbb3-type cytochrome oxidase assembly protein CcoS [Agarilytica sp.]